MSSGCRACGFTRAVSSAGLRAMCHQNTSAPSPSPCGTPKGKPLPARMASQRGEGLHCFPTFDSKHAQSSHHHAQGTAWEMQHLLLHENKLHASSRRKSKDPIIRQIQAELCAWKGAASPPPTSSPSEGALPTALAGWAGQTRCWHPARRGLLTSVGAHSGKGALCPQGLGLVRQRARAALSGGNRPLPTSVSNCSHTLQLQGREENSI